MPFDMVRIADFWIGRCEVTWGEYQPFCDEYDKPPAGVDASTRPSPPGHGVPPQGLGSGRQPAMGLTRNAAERYCEWLSRKTGRTYRLPTADEWERACRGGSAGAYSFGDSDTALDAHAWFADNAGGMSHEVGQKKPNALGLFDMHGNVWEYTSDGRLRGGSYADAPEKLRASHQQEFLFTWIERDPQRPRSRWWAFDGPVGFRLARSE